MPFLTATTVHRGKKKNILRPFVAPVNHNVLNNEKAINIAHTILGNFCHGDETKNSQMETMGMDACMMIVGNLPEGYIRNVPLPRVPRDQSTLQSRVPPVHMIPRYYEDMYAIPMYDSTCRIGERVATANSPQWQPIAINT
jgi:hypothetical protein